MEFQVYSITVEERYPRALPPSNCVEDVHEDDFSETIRGVPVEKKHDGCIAFVWGRTAEGDSAVVRVEGVRPRLFFEMHPGDTVASMKRELESEVDELLFRDSRTGIDVVERQMCHFYGYEPDLTKPSGRVVHRYAEAYYPNLASWRRAARIRKGQELRHAKRRLIDMRIRVKTLDDDLQTRRSEAMRGDAVVRSTFVSHEKQMETYRAELKRMEERFRNLSEGWEEFQNEHGTEGDEVLWEEGAPQLRAAQEWFVDPTTRFIQESGVVPSKWIRVPETECECRVTCCTHELECNIGDFECIERDEDAPYKSLYYDIETLGLEPEHSEIIQISMVFKQGDKKTKYLVCIGKHAFIDGVIIVECATERDLLLAFRRILMTEDPEFVIAYNGVNFDNRFISVRAIREGANEAFYLSRFLLKPCRLRELQLKSSGMGDNLLRYFDMTGRSNFDWYVKLKRDLTQEDSYSLDYMAKKFCGAQKVELASGLKWKRVSDNVECDPAYELKQSHLLGAAVGSNVLHTFTQSEWHALDVKEDLCEHHWIRSSETGKRYRPANTKHRAIPDLFHGTDQDRARLGYYCVEDSDLLDELDTACTMIIQILQFAGIFGINAEWVYFRGQQVRFVSQLLRKVRVVEKVPLLLQRPPEGFSGEGSETFEGATVNEPKKGLHKKPVAVLDWKSLYPAIMMSCNLCHSTYVKEPSLFDMEGVKRYEIDSNYVTHFVSDTVHKGILPIMLEELGEERTHAKKMTKTFLKKAKEVDVTPEEKRRCLLMAKVWDGRQLAIKVSMNSIYGACGTSVEAGAKFPCQAISATVTYQGRMAMVIKKELLPKHFPGIEVVYGDTDSVMVVFPDCDDVQTCGKLGAKAADIVTDHFVRVLLMKKMELEFEKCYQPYLLQGKKRYVGHKYEPDGDDEMVSKGIDAKGVETERKDTLPYVKDIFYDVRDALMLPPFDETEALRRFCVRMDALVDNAVPIEKLTLKKNLSSKVEGKVDTIVQARVNAKRREREPGSEANTNEQVEYVILNGHKNSNTTALAEDPVYAREEGLKLNRLWYFEHCIRDAMKKVFEATSMADAYLQKCEYYKQRLNAERLNVNRDSLLSAITIGGGSSASASSLPPPPAPPRPPPPSKKRPRKK